MTVYRQKTLVIIQALVNDESLELARSLAEADTAAMVELFNTEHYVSQLVEECRSYAEQLQQGGHTQSLDKLTAACQETPIEFTKAEPAEPEPFANDLHIGDKLGEIFQRACNYPCKSAWQVLSKRHELI